MSSSTHLDSGLVCDGALGLVNGRAGGIRVLVIGVGLLLASLLLAADGLAPLGRERVRVALAVVRLLLVLLLLLDHQVQWIHTRWLLLLLVAVDRGPLLLVVLLAVTWALVRGRMLAAEAALVPDRGGRLELGRNRVATWRGCVALSRGQTNAARRPISRGLRAGAA